MSANNESAGPIVVLRLPEQNKPLLTYARAVHSALLNNPAFPNPNPPLDVFAATRDAQHADLRPDPDPAREAERVRLGLLGRIAAVLCLIDVFAHAPHGSGSGRSRAGRPRKRSLS